MYRPWFEDPYTMFRRDRESLEGGVGRMAPRQSVGVFPPVNLYDNGESYLVRAEMPGIDKDNLDISSKGDQLVIRGERVIEAVEESANFHRREREGGQFRRVLTLPQPIDGGKVSAEYKNGVLEIYAPRAEEAKPRKIKLK
ncbi:MAG: Hsp20/alpha crystallin family protein [Bradymonadaceae bacterium]